MLGRFEWFPRCVRVAQAELTVLPQAHRSDVRLPFGEDGIQVSLHGLGESVEIVFREDVIRARGGSSEQFVYELGVNSLETSLAAEDDSYDADHEETKHAQNRFEPHDSLSHPGFT